MITSALILLNLVAFALQELSGDAIVARYALWPLGRFHVRGMPGTVGFEVWQIGTSAFLHGGLSHLVLNMFALHMFGREVERALGSWRFLRLYTAAIVTAALVQLLVVSLPGARPVPTIGASGGVFGVLLAFGMIYPRRIVTLLFPPIPMPAWLFVTAYGAIELANGVLGSNQGVAHFAHLGGMLGAYGVLRRWRWRRRRYA